MAQLALFTKIRVFYNGKLVFREATVRMTNHSGLIPTFDVNSGFAGVTQGSSFVTMEVEQIVPAQGADLFTELDQQQANVVSISLLTNTGSSYTSDGFVMESEIMHGVNQETKYRFTFEGEASTWLIVPAVAV